MRPMVSASVPSRSNRTTGQRCEVARAPQGRGDSSGQRVHAAATDGTARTTGIGGFPAAPTPVGLRHWARGTPLRGARRAAVSFGAHATSALTELVHPSWAAALAPVETVARSSVSSCAGRSPPVAATCPAAPRAARLRAPAGRRAGPHRGPGPLPDPGPRGRALVFGGAGRAARPRSLVNIYRELETDLGLPPRPPATSPRGRTRASCCSTGCSPCAPGKPASHRGKGWET